MLYTQITTKRTGYRRSSASPGPQPPTRPASPRLSLTARAADRARFDSDAARRAQQAEVASLRLFVGSLTIASAACFKGHFHDILKQSPITAVSNRPVCCRAAPMLRPGAHFEPVCCVCPYRRSSWQRRQRVQSARLLSWPHTARRSSSRWAHSAGQTMLALADPAQPYLLRIVCYLPQHQLAANTPSQL